MSESAKKTVLSEGYKTTNENLKKGYKPTVEGYKPTVEGYKPTIERGAYQGTPPPAPPKNATSAVAKPK